MQSSGKGEFVRLMRRSNRYIISILALGLWGPMQLRGQQDFAKVGTSGSQFLDISPDARYAAMGNAAVSMPHSSASAVFYNPAALVMVPGISASFNSVQWFADINFQGAAVSFPMANWTIALNYRSLNSGDILVTTVDQQQGTGEYYQWLDLAAGLAISRRLADRFSFGMNFYYVRESIGDYGLEVNTYGVDVGTLYLTGFKSLRLGMAIRNFGPELFFKDADGQLAEFEDYSNGEILPDKEAYRPFHMPLLFQVGLSYDLFESSQLHNLSVAIDGVHPNDSYERFNIGLEYSLMGRVFVRGGLYSKHDTSLNMFGVGALVSTMGIQTRVDYSISNYQTLGFVHQFTITINSAG